jgi:hypothetical protein
VYDVLQNYNNVKLTSTVRFVELGGIADIPNTMVHASSKLNEHIAAVTKEDGAWMLSATSSPEDQGMALAAGLLFYYAEDLTLDCPES